MLPELLALYAEAKRKFAAFGYCFLPAVLSEIGAHRQIIDQDLISAFEWGRPVDGWPFGDRCLVVSGVDCEGSPLLVVVGVPRGDDPVLFTKFMVPLD